MAADVAATGGYDKLESWLRERMGAPHSSHFTSTSGLISRFSCCCWLTSCTHGLLPCLAQARVRGRWWLG